MLLTRTAIAARRAAHYRRMADAHASNVLDNLQAGRESPSVRERWSYEESTYLFAREAAHYALLAMAIEER